MGPNWKVQFTLLPPGGAGAGVVGPPSWRWGTGRGWGAQKESQRSALLVTRLPVGVFLIQQELVNQKDCPYMCAYKLVTVKFKWWGLQNKVENFIHKVSDQAGGPSGVLVGGVLPDKRRSYNPMWLVS